MPFLTVAGYKAYYAHRRPVPAAQPPVVLIHGAGGTHQHWLYQVRDLPQAPSYAPDLPGHGRSEGAGRDSIAAYGDWLVAFLDAAGLERAVLVGHSMGGATALDTALRYPDRVVGLGLVATGARLRVAPALLVSIQQDRDRAIRLLSEWTYGPEVPDELVRLGRRQLAEISAEVLYGDFAACDAFDVMGRLGGIGMPALVVCGTKDRMTPSKYSVYLRDQIAGATLHLVEGAGHMVMLERPQAVVNTLSTFLERL
jgi:pimeloyl-ACP methyl ester carboxylesterase